MGFPRAGSNPAADVFLEINREKGLKETIESRKYINTIITFLR
jgi:hypothetical protein